MKKGGKMKNYFSDDCQGPRGTLQNIACALAQKKARLTAVRIDDSKEDLSAYLADDFDFSTIQSLQMMGICLNDRKNGLIASIEKALSRIQRGVFGTCEACSGAISSERLEALPYTELCLECKEVAEEQALSIFEVQRREGVISHE